MKKSMLLSTIAMIVVVVVALSTATFAWFSSFESVTTTADLTIAATSAGIEVREAAENAQWSNSLKKLEAASLSPVSPKTDIEYMTSPADSAYKQSAYTPAEFFTATTKADGHYIGGEVNKNAHYIFVEFQVRNAGTVSKELTITTSVEPKSKDAPTDQDKAAVKNTKIVVAYVKGVGSKTGTTLSGSTFNYKMSDGETVDTFTENQKYNLDKKGATSGKTIDSANFSATDTLTKNVLTITAANNTNAEWYTVGVYIWIDGYNVDNQAAGASISAKIEIAQAPTPVPGA